MRYCKKCTMPDTRPGITFDAEGVCSACRHYESRKNVDWDARFKEFEAYCDKYRGMNGPGGYDCAVAVSGGKDSHFQVWMLKEVMHMNPILFSVEDNFPMTQAGIHNLKNISEEFGCTIISCTPNIKVQKTLMRKFFEKYGKPTWYVDRLIYTFPLHMAAKFNTPMLCYGENVSFEYGGNADKETYSAMGQIENGVAVGMPMEELLGDGVTEKDLSLTLAPSAEERAKLDPFYMSYFVPWNSYKNYQIAKAHGFHDLTHEWDRTHHAENLAAYQFFVRTIEAGLADAVQSDDLILCNENVWDSNAEAESAFFSRFTGRALHAQVLWTENPATDGDAYAYQTYRNYGGYDLAWCGRLQSADSDLMDGVQVYVQSAYVPDNAVIKYKVRLADGAEEARAICLLDCTQTPRDRNGDYLATVEDTSIVNAKLMIWDG